jgi:hypothetical protein
LTLPNSTGTIRTLVERTSHLDDTARRPRVGYWLSVACFALTLLFTLPAWAGNLIQVRVGNHPTYTRVVFEFDAPTGYRIERRAAGESEKTILVTLDAASRKRNIVSKSVAVESIDVDSRGARAVAHIMTRHAGIPIREMILSNPPRVVLDLMIPGAKPAPKAAVAEAKPPAPEREAQPEPAAVRPDEVVVAEPEPQPAVVEPEIASEPLIEVPDLVAAPTQAEEIAEVEEAAAEAAVVAEAADEAGAQVEVAVDGSENPAAEPVAEATDEIAAEAAETDAPLVVIDMADLTGGADPIEPDARPEVPETPAASESVKATSQARAKTGDEAASFDLKWAGMIGAGVMALLVLVALVIRSRRSKSDDMDVMDVTALADEAADQASHEGRIPEGGFAMDADLHEGAPPDEDFEFGAAEPHDDENKPIQSVGVASAAKPGRFDESHQEKDAMSMENQNLPTSHIDSEAATQVGISTAAVGADMDSGVAQLIQEFERRLGHMEARLDESNEARERLERQVEAQAEELRVQRAAIARTQRAVRSLNRPEEEQATEPALRDPSTPTS